MPKSSFKSVIAAALVVLAVLWENTDEQNHLALSDIVRKCSAKGFSVDKRLVYATIDGAQDAGFEVKRPRGRGRHSEGCRWEKRPIAAWEVGLLCDTVSCSRSLSMREKASLKTRLLNLAPRHSRFKLSREISVGPQIEVYKGNLEKKLGTINEAIKRGTRIDFTYWEFGVTGKLRKRESSSQTEVEPYQFLYQNDSYFLLAGKPTQEGIVPRTYRLDRMSEVRLLDVLCESSLTDLHINADEALSQSFGMFLEGNAAAVSLAFEQDIAKHVAERFGPKVIHKRSDGRAEALVTVRPSAPFYAWVFQFAGSMTIEGPEPVVAEYRSMLSRCARSDKS